MRPTLIVITGPTASGKTSVAIEVAKRLKCDIISADSRQIYRDIPIVSAAPTLDEMQGIAHHFVGTLPLDAYYSASRFEADVLSLLPELFEKNGCAVMCGGSMMYIDAVTDGIDELPDISPQVRDYVSRLLADQGLKAVMAQLEVLDPAYASQVDAANHKRVAHALEICLEAGRPYSILRSGQKTPRPFQIVKVAIDMPREMLFDRINRRLDTMINAGLIEEARNLYHLRHLNSLNTVGLKELFAHFDGTMPLEIALARIAKNTRVYAKKQITWLKRPGIRPAIAVDSENAVALTLSLLQKGCN